MRKFQAAILAAVAVCFLAATGGGIAEASRSARADFTFGVIPQQSLRGQDFKTMRNGGLSSLRIGMFWPEVEASPGAIDWSGYDSLVGKAAKRGITLLPYLYGTPTWAANYDGIPCSADCTKYAPVSYATKGAFAFFASEAVRQYGPDGRYWTAHPEIPYTPIRTWQVWNEQNSAKYFAPAPDVGSYAWLLGWTSSSIRSVDPGAEVVLGGMWGPSGAKGVVPTATYLRRLYRYEGVKQSFDSLGLHPYSSNLEGVLEQVRSARRAAKRSGDRRVGILITELGWASKGPDGHHLVKGRQGQAEILEDTYTTLLEHRREWRIGGAWWYAWRDTPADSGFICLWCPGAGLRAEGGGPKPAWRSMKRLARPNRG